MAHEKILVIDDEPEIGWLFSKILADEGYQVYTSLNSQEGISKIKKEKPNLVFLDIKLPGVDGIETLRKIRKFDNKLLVIILTAYETVKTAVEAMKMGAYDYLSKPIDNEKIKIIIDNALRTQNLTKEVAYLRGKMKEEFSFDSIVGNSPQMKDIHDLVKTVASHDITVLLQGKSGTGKELIAQAIHYGSSRADKPFVVIDSGIFPDTLVESEIFGYEKGAFTGAYKRKLGKFEMAQEGTVFLDEIGNLTMQTQVKLLRALQEREIERLGGKRPIKVDVRLIAATNLNLEKAIKEGSFREDLYYRINVFPINLPPLKEREGDIPILARHFLSQFNQGKRKKVESVSPQALELLINYSWPGNVRELRNVIESTILMADDTILPFHLPSKIQNEGLRKTKLKGALKDVSNLAKKKVEKEFIINVLNEVEWNKSKAARALDVDYKTLYNKIKEFNIKRGQQDY